MAEPEIRTFETGATRDLDDDKLKYEGFISPLVEKRYAEYMHFHRHQKDGSMRPPDNWQKGINLESYADSLVRHVMDFRLHFDNFGDEATEANIENVLCAIIFNAKGYLFEKLKHRLGYSCPLVGCKIIGKHNHNGGGPLETPRRQKQTKSELLRRLGVLIGAIYETPEGGCGCCLHIVLDDGNWEKESVEWCRDNAKHGICREVAELLLLLTEEGREVALGGGSIDFLAVRESQILDF